MRKVNILILKNLAGELGPDLGISADVMILFDIPNKRKILQDTLLAFGKNT